MTTDDDVKNLDKSLKLNSGNVDAVRQKYAALDKSQKKMTIPHNTMQYIFR